MKKRTIPLFLLGLLLAFGCGEKTDTLMAVKAATPIPEAAGATDHGAAGPAHANVTIAVRRDSQTVFTRDLSSQEDIRLVEEIVFDYMVKSAAWEGVEASTLENAIALFFDWTEDGERQTFYQYDMDGRHVLQAGEAGMFSIMGDRAYANLLRLAGLAESPSSGAADSAEETAAPTPYA